MSLTIFGAPISPFVRKVRVVLAEKGLVYDLEAVNVFDPPSWFSQMSPLKRIPVLRDTRQGEETLADSSAICAYLERRHPSPALYPSDDWAYGQALFLEEYADTELAAQIGFNVFRPRVVFPMMGKQGDEEKVQKALTETLPRIFDYLEARLDGRAFFIGEAFTIADISIATHFVNLAMAGETVDAARWPGLARFVAQTHGRASFQTAMAPV